METAMDANDINDIRTYGNPIRLAWGVILLAFATFCFLCASITLGTYFFLFQSSVALSAELQVSSGTIGIREGSSAEQTETGNRLINQGMMVRTDEIYALSQTTITFRDPSYDNQVVAAITLKGDTAIMLDSNQRPRFEWSSGFYEIRLSEFTGELDVTIPSGLRRDVEVSINTPQDIEVLIIEGGRYIIDSSPSQLSVVNREGLALLLPPEPMSPRSIPIDYQGIYRNDADEVQIIPWVVNLVRNSSLMTFTPDEADFRSETFNDLDIPIGWECRHDFEGFNRVPVGEYESSQTPDGRRSFRLVRSNADNNVATGCLQTVNADITGYDDLVMQATLYIDSQSLSACGERASECPLMMQVEFEDINYDSQGNPIVTVRVWRQGIYAKLETGRPWPLICDTCRRDHVRIYEDAWYIYSSGNIFDFFAEDEQPERIRSVSFYASGHNYDVYVSEVALLASQNAGNN